MDIPVRRGNIFTLLEDEEAEEVQVPKSKQTKTPAAPAAQPKVENKSAKPKPPAKKPQRDPEPPVQEAPKSQAKEQRKPKYEDKPERDDRKSKTGRGREIKKGGAGRNNWGKPEDDAKPDPSSELPEDQNKATEGEPDQSDNKEDKPAEAEAEKKPDFITFSDFLHPKVAEDEEGKEDSEEETDNAKGLLNFKVAFGNRGDSSGGRGRRGGRGGRGGRGRRDWDQRDENDKDKGARDQKGGKKNYEQKPKTDVKTESGAAPNPNDFKAFPSLG